MLHAVKNKTHVYYWDLAPNPQNKVNFSTGPETGCKPFLFQQVIRFARFFTLFSNLEGVTPVMFFNQTQKMF